MKKIRIRHWLFPTLLSASFYTIAFFGAPYAMVIALIFMIKALKGRQTRDSFLVACVWAIIVYSTHFLWVFALLSTKTSCGFLTSLLLYFLLVAYFTIMTGLFFLMGRIITGSSLLSRCVQITSYFLFIECYGLWLFGCPGYPFINPFVPFYNKRWFLIILVHACRVLYGPEHYQKEHNFTSIAYIRPPVCNGDTLNTSLDIFHRLINENSSNIKLLACPESTFPFALNRHAKEVNLWASTLSQGQHFFIGSQYQNDNNQWGQAAYWITNKGIQGVYIKKHYIPFVEQIPPLFKSWTLLKDLFLQDYYHMSLKSCTEERRHFPIEPSICVIPLICSELFFTRLKLYGREFLGSNSKIFVLFFVNDSRFVDYFRKLMENVAYMKSVLIGCPVVYIGHKHGKIIWWKTL